MRTAGELSSALGAMELELLREIRQLKYDLSRHEEEQGKVATPSRSPIVPHNWRLSVRRRK